MPVVTDGAPALQASASVAARGIDIVDPILVRARSPAARAWFGLEEHLRSPVEVVASHLEADWIVHGNVLVVGLAGLARRGGRRPVVSWDGDAASRWHTTYVRWLLRRDPVRAARRSILVVSARRSERRLSRHCDFATVPGPADLEALMRPGRDRTPVFIVPNVVRFGQDPDTSDVARPNLDILFVGSAYGPNVDGLRWFLDRVWPLVQRCRPEARVTVAGHNLHQTTIYGSGVSPPGVDFVGRVANLEPLYRSAKVVIVPLFYGSGVPNKFLEALAANTGIVTTQYVTEAVGSPRGLLSRDRANAWVDGLVKALNDPHSARVDSAVRGELLSTNGPAGFDLAMRTVLAYVRRLRES